MSPLPPPDGSSPDTTLRAPQGGGSRGSNGLGAHYQSDAEIELELEALSAKHGIPITRVRIRPGQVISQVRVLETRRDRRRFRRVWKARAKAKRKAERRAFRRAYPWHVRYPNAARVLLWTLILASVAFFVFADRLATYLPKH